MGKVGDGRGAEWAEEPSGQERIELLSSTEAEQEQRTQRKVSSGERAASATPPPVQWHFAPPHCEIARRDPSADAKPADCCPLLSIALPLPGSITGSSPQRDQSDSPQRAHARRRPKVAAQTKLRGDCA